MDKRIEKLRKEVDRIDKELIRLFGERFVVTKKIGQIKKEVKLEVVDQKRWVDILDKNLVIAQKSGLQASFIKKIYHLIHQASVKAQKGI